MTETPKEAARRLAAPAIAKGFQPAGLHTYCGADGAPLYWRIRAKHENGDKWIRPMKLTGHGYELGEPRFPNGKPLYRLDAIATALDATVWIVEGEKAADALTKAGLVATTSGGADTADAADWSPLCGRTCRLWPDNDEPGQRYMMNVTARLLSIGCTVATLDVAQLNLPPRADAVEWLESHSEASTSDFEALPVRRPQPEPYNAMATYLEGPQVALVRGDTVKIEAIAWLWAGFLAEGKLHIVAGAPGTGKTTLALDFAAAVTCGGRWPDGTRAPIGDVLVWSGEDAPSDTLAPRLRAAGADMSRVHFVGDVRQGGEPVPFDPATHFPALALAASRLPDLRLMIVDPIVSAVAGDSHHNAEVRRGLQPLVTFAEQQGVALIGITHFTKGTQGKEPLERVTGSLGFGAVARIVLGTAKMAEEDGGGRVLVRVKSNIGPDGGGFKYELLQVDLTGELAGIVASRVEWAGSVDGSARDILASAEHVEAENEGGGDPKEFLRYLLELGPMPATTVFRDAEAHGYSKRQMQRARAAIGARVDKQGMKGGWEWSLPKVPLSPEGAEDATHNCAAPSAPSAESSADGVDRDPASDGQTVYYAEVGEAF